MSCEHDCTAAPAFPALLFNRPGLPRIEHRIGGYAEMRAHILALIDADPRLAAWTHRGADDPGIALAEGAAIVGDILAFYQSLYANECFLRTARWRESVADLVRLTGYRLAPGLAGETLFALLLKGDRPVTVPQGFGFKTRIEGQPQPAMFETSASLTAWPRLGAFHLYRPRREARLANGARELVTLEGLGDLGLAAGDRLLLGVPDRSASPERLTHAQIAVVARTWEAFGHTHVELEGGLQSFAVTIQVSPLEGLFGVQQLTPGAVQAAVQATNQAAVAGEQQIATVPLVLQSARQPAFAGLGVIQAQAFGAVADTPALAGSAARLMAFKLASSHRHFGHDAPAQQVTIDSKGRATTSAVSYVRNLAAGTGTPASPALGPAQIALDSAEDKLTAGTLVIVQGRAGGSAGAPRSHGLCEVRRVRRTEKTGLSWGPQNGAVSLLTVDGSLGGGGAVAADIRTLNIHAVEGEGFLVRAPLVPVAAARGRELDFYGTADEAAPLADRELLLQYADGSQANARVVDTGPTGSGGARMRRITLDIEVDYARFGHDAPEVTVYGNLAHATQGETQPVAVLGDGDARQSFQNFPLPKPPLTYLLRPQETPAQHAELRVWVAGVQWSRVDSLFGTAPDAQVYVLREDADGKTQVQFGDGKTGARLPSGKGNVTVSWRSGSGACGPAVAGTAPQAKSRLDGLDKLLMPQPVVGGAAPETEDLARVAAPGRMQSLGRLVSLADYEAEALALPGVLKARARWAESAGLPSLRLTVLTASESPAEAAKLEQSLQALDRAKGTRRQRLEVVQGRRLRIRAGIEVSYDPRRIAADIEAAVLEALGVSGSEDPELAGGDGLFALARRRFGQSVHSSQLLGVVQNLEGIRWARLTALQPTGLAARRPIAFPRRLTLGAVRAGNAASPPLTFARAGRIAPPLRLAPGPAVFSSLVCPDDAILVLEHDDLGLALLAEDGGRP